MRGFSGASLLAMASVFVACATGGAGAFDDGQAGTIESDAGQTGHAGDAGTSGSSSGGSSGAGASGGGSGSSSGSSGGGGGDDASEAGDSGGDDGSGSSSGGSSGGPPDSGSSSGGQDAGTGTGFCANNATYYAEALLAIASNKVVLCSPAGCQGGQCCFQAINQVPVSLCVQQ